MSTPHINAKPEDFAKTVLMPGDPLRSKFIAENFLENPVLVNNVRGVQGYTGTYKGKKVSVMASGMGMPSMGIYSYELIKEYGVKNLIRVGTAGSFSSDITLGEIVMGISASTDSNYIHGFDAPPGYAPTASYDLLIKTEEVNKNMNLKLNAGNIVSCDVFYEQKENWWKKWAKMNVLAVEMEAAALYMNAAYLGANALAMVTVTDHFITGETATVSEREHANEDMIKLALEVATK